MKKLVLITVFVVVLLVLIILTAEAVEIKLSKEIYAPAETLQAEIYGNFLDGIKLENIYFYRERNIPIDYDILKTQDKHLLYALLPHTEGNYTLKIRNTRYETETGISYSDIIKEFTIKATNETSLSINPGFVVARDDFYIEVKSNKNIEIEAEFLEQKQSISLSEGKEKKIYFSISEIKNYTEANVKIKDCNIPVFVFPEKSEGIEETPKFRFNPGKIEFTILKKESYFFKVSLINFGNKNISDIKLSSNISDSGLNVELAPNSISKLEPGEREFINLTLSSEKKGNFSGSIFAVSENLSAELKLDIEVTENKSEINYTSSSSSPGYTEEKGCEEIGGKFCKEEGTCSVPLELTSDSYGHKGCCKGECKAEKKSSTWIYGLIIIIVVIAGLIFFAFYMKKKQKKAIDILKEREKKYKERMAGQGEEVRGSLTKD